ncbi:coiled-coil domain-containing protein 82 isoform X2 [Anolis carolinensis]|uniref:coiled-coil domain-containing protein 82 isoform X2 n=1 Tax=Anolis carolinensis TaxID=28377 RepID=UPI0002C8956E|nr:PREDICTED: coiled-coil domain-containing protein 82 isoform X2 [Anolis carolinensis]|eukprot:XP_016848168.1 PREDICTED: coiled-coil domain-containing protein 82 isoform X2 [Anolis carolinensis]
METNSVSRRYETRRSTKAEKPIARSRVDWRRTKRSSILLYSKEEDESAVSSEIETSSEDYVEGIENNGSILNESKDKTAGEKENNGSFHSKSNDEAVKEKDESILNQSKDEALNEEEDNESTPNKNKSGTMDGAGSPQGGDTDIEEAEDTVNVKSKRVRTSIMYDSDDSDDSGIVRKVFAKRKCILDEEDLPVDEEQHMLPAEEIANRKQNRLMKLQELCQQRSTRTFSNSDCHKVDEDDTTMLYGSHHSSLSEAELGNTSDDDSMKDFIVEEEEGDRLEQENSGDESQPRRGEQRSLLEKHIPDLIRVEHFVHFQRVVKSFLINAFDATFLSSLYKREREKKYAKEMLNSLHYLDDHFIQPRLENLLCRSRWKERYKERVDSYPNVFINMGRVVKRSCQACELQRYCKYTVILSGKLYNNETLELDDFMSQDKQTLKIGTTCADRTHVYHNLKHFKYKLYQNCCWVVKNDGIRDESVKDSVERIFKQLDEDNWIHEQHRKLLDYMDRADSFQDEKID